MMDDLRALLAHETDDPVPADDERRIRAGLASLLAASPPVAAPSPSPSPSPVAQAAAGATIKATTAVLLGLGLAAGGFAAGRATSPPAAPAPSVTLPAPTAVVAPPSVSVPLPLESPPPSASAAPSAPTPLPRPPSGEATPSAFDREQSLLARARAALVRHDANAAAEALEAHAKQFPSSRNAEERDYLRIQVLRERGDVAAARERARAFLEAHPDSLLRTRVEPLAR